MKPSDIFNCKKCGDCCRGYGGTFVSLADVKAIAAYVGTDPDAFVANCCESSGGRPVLARAENGCCMFWDQVCTIHPAKPRMCKAWPFIESVLTDVANWHIMASVCPGMRTDVSDNVVRACVKEMLFPTETKVFI